MPFHSGDPVRLKFNVGSSFYDHNEVYITGTTGSIVTIINPQEFIRLSGYSLISSPNKSNSK
jgi:hypothetical protein